MTALALSALGPWPASAVLAQTHTTRDPAAQAAAQPALTKGEIKALREFKLLDFNGDGRLSRSEVQLFPRLGERRRQLAGSMSGGEQQMCAMARALMAAPVLMMIDEMSLGLAPVIVDQLTEVLAEIRNNGVTVLLVEQDVQVALRAADRAYVIENGRVTLAGAARELIDDPAVQQAYLGV